MGSTTDADLAGAPTHEAVDRRMTAEQVLFLQHACALMEQRKYKPNWPRVMFNRRFGFWPTIANSDVVPLEPTDEFKAWVKENSSRGGRVATPQDDRFEAFAARHALEPEERTWLTGLIARGRIEPDLPSAASGDLARRLSALLSRWQSIERELRNGRATVAARRLRECIDELEAAVAPVGKTAARSTSGHEKP